MKRQLPGFSVPWRDPAAFLIIFIAAAGIHLHRGRRRLSDAGLRFKAKRTVNDRAFSSFFQQLSCLPVAFFPFRIPQLRR